MLAAGVLVELTDAEVLVGMLVAEVLVEMVNAGCLQRCSVLRC